MKDPWRAVPQRLNDRRGIAEARQLATAVGINHAVPISAVAGADSMATITIILSPVIAIFLPHEGIRVLFELLANFGVALQDTPAMPGGFSRTPDY